MPSNGDSNLSLGTHLKPVSKKNNPDIELTHTRFGNDDLPGAYGNARAGSYSIKSVNDDCWKAPEDFYEALHKFLFIDNKKLTLTERHLSDRSPVVVDLDMSYDKEIFPNNKLIRQHTISQLKHFCKELIGFYSKYLEFDDNDIEIFVMEREGPYLDDKGPSSRVKDGVHIIIPNIVADYKIHFYVRELMLEKIPEIFKDLKLLHTTNAWKDVYDKSVIETNGWLMYGCAKPKRKSYLVSNIFDSDINEINNNYSNLELIKILSIRRNYEISQYKDGVEDEVTKNSGYKKKKDKKKNVAGLDDDDVQFKDALLNFSGNIDPEEMELCKKIVKGLGSNRAADYQDWKMLGLCLHNICQNKDMLELWKDFSSQSPKYSPGEHNKIWLGFIGKKDGMKMGTLWRWLKEDNFQLYEELQKNNIFVHVMRCVRYHGHDHDIALVLFEMYKDKFVCVNTQKQVWYEFKDHKWNLSDGSCPTLRSKISSMADGDGLLREFFKVQQALATKCAQLVAEEGDYEDEIAKLQEQIKEIGEITDSKKAKGGVKTSQRKDKIMKEAAELFNTKSIYAKDFMDNLDSDPYKLAFTNGVLVLEPHNIHFRDGRPDDYIEKSTNIKWPKDEDELDQDMIDDIESFMDDILPDPSVAEYVWKLIASCMVGGNKDEKFHVWTGSGGNGKSLLINILEASFGEYQAKVNPTLLTRKRTSSAGPQPEMFKTKGARLVSMQEPDEKEPINSGLMKEISGGDTGTCRALHAMPVTFTPMYTPILMCNAKPHVNPQDEAVWRRLRVVDFPVKFVYNPNPNDKFQKQRDDTLKEKIKLWPSAFMYKLLSYYKMYVQDEKLEEPEPILRFTTEYQKECDHFSAFFDEHIEKIEPPLENVQPESTLNTIDRLFKTWVLHQNIAKDQIPNKKDLQKMLEKKYGNMELDGHRKGWYNIRTKEDDIF